MSVDYEVTYILRPTLEETDVDARVDAIAEGLKGNGGEMEYDKRHVRTQADPLEQPQQKYIRLEVNGGRAKAGVGIAIGEVESLRKRLAAIGDVIWKVVLNESRGNQPVPPRAQCRPGQRNEGWDAHEQSNHDRDFCGGA